VIHRVRYVKDDFKSFEVNQTADSVHGFLSGFDPEEN
jgi:hypothetical protein